MDTLTVQTSQNVYVEHDVASVAERIVAHLIDYMFFGSWAFVMGLVMKYSVNETWVTVLVIFLPFVFYDLVCEITMDGQNIGKRIMGLKVIKTDGSSPGIGDYLIRWVFRLVDNVLFFGVISVLLISFRGKGQRLGDILAGTAVVKVKAEPKSPELVPFEVPDDYRPVFPAAIQLSDKDIATVRELLDFFRQEGYNSTAPGMIVTTKQVIEKKLHIESDLLPVDFLKTILQDYYALTRRG